jgi:integrase
MPKIKRELTVAEIKRLTEGTHFVGGVGGLTLQVGNYSDVLKRHPASWVLRVYVGSKKRHIGIGSYPEIDPSEARNRALKLKAQVAQGVDPKLEKTRLQGRLNTEREKAKTFKFCAETYLNIHDSDYRNRKHAMQWRTTLSCYAYPKLGAKLVSEITIEDIVAVLSPIWNEKTETAKRLQSRIERVFEYAISCGYLETSNPARWKGYLSLHLASPSKIAETKHYPSLPYRALPNFIQQLHNRSGIAAKALEFLILTAVRSETVRNAKWSEIDLESGEWRIPKDHTKTKKGEHRVPLTNQMIALLKSIDRKPRVDLIFPSTKGTRLSDMALNQLLRKMRQAGLIPYECVPHGFRSSFKVWATEQTNFPTELSEIALMHTVGDSVYKAYQRSDLFEKRRTLMEEWNEVVYEQICNVRSLAAG